MSRIILLDSGPLGMVTNPRATPENDACRAWMSALLLKGILVYVPEITDYEIRRELLRGGKVAGIRRLDQLSTVIGYLPLTTSVMRQAAEFWAQLRRHGIPTADDKALDGDVILAAQAASLSAPGDNVVVATTNVGHIGRLVAAEQWQHIIP